MISERHTSTINGKTSSTLFGTLFKRSLLILEICASVMITSVGSALTLSQQIAYYGDDFYAQVASGTRDKALISELQTILESRHKKNASGKDTIDANCDTASKDCYQHNAIGYSAARKIIMGQLFLSGTPGNYAVKDVYCEKDYTNRDFGGADQVGPGKIPSDSVINTEHTWPQSRFNRSMNKETQKSDLHHLFPTDSQLNGIRGNHKFAEVENPDRALKCPASKFGTIKGSSEDYFEPPMGHKGNVARALFYFSVRYHISIDADEEAYLKKWNRQDPPNADELAHNEAVFKIQGNRNPFIDYPELADAISDF